jgi:hypothetical protein
MLVIVRLPIAWPSTPPMIAPNTVPAARFWGEAALRR